MKKYFSEQKIRQAISAGLSIGYDKGFDISNQSSMVDKVMNDIFLKEGQFENNKWEKALVSLTPGGSEFCGDADYCVKFVKEFQASQHKKITELLLAAKNANSHNG